MEWTIVRVKGILKELSRDHQDEFNIPVTINGRLTRTLGRVFHTIAADGKLYPERMEFSKQLLETATDTSIIDVIKHEWCHYYITKISNQNHGHDAQFKALCARLGCNGGTSINVERTAEVKNK